MRVLIVSQYFWPESFGINALAQTLCRHGIEVTVLTGQPNYPEGRVYAGYSPCSLKKEFFDGITILRIPLFPRGKQSSVRLALNYLSFILSGCVFGPLMLRRQSFDVIFVYAPSPLLQAIPAMFMAWLKRMPMALWVQDLWPESLSATGFIKNKWVLACVKRIVRVLYHHADRILIPSEAFRAPIEKLVSNASKIVYYPNAYAETSSQEEPNKRLSALTQSLSEAFSVVFAGNLGTAQSLGTIIDAAEKISGHDPAIRFYFIGSGSQSDWLRREIRLRNLNNVVLCGRYPFSAMPDIFAAASVLLVSLKDEPIFSYTVPSKVQAYLAAGKPIIASLNGEGARIVADAGAGIACKAEDSQALADAVVFLSSLSQDRRDEMGENARCYAHEHYSLNKLAAGLIQQFSDITAHYQRSRR